MTLATALYGSGIRSVQKGTITIANANTSNTATISSVNTAKAFVLFGGHTGTDATYSLSQGVPKLDLTNATTVTANRDAQAATQSLTVSYTVVEFN